MLKIWGRTTSSNVQKVLWTCAELGVEYERVDWGGPFGGNNDPNYRAMNPNGLVPTVQDGQLIIWESNTICRYLCATRNGARLHPTDPGRRTEVERWMDWQLATIGSPMGTMLAGYYRTPPEKRDTATLEGARKRAIELWTIVDDHLNGRRYMAGDGLTLADIVLGMFVYRWFNYPIERPTLARLKSYYDRLGENRGFQAHIAIPIS